MPTPRRERGPRRRRRDGLVGDRRRLRTAAAIREESRNDRGDRDGLLLNDVASDRWADPDWIAREHIVAFAGQPLVFRGETLGVVAIFRRAPISSDEFRWLRALADYAAVAIAHARAFSENERLRERLERENTYLREEVDTALAFGRVIGRNRALRRVLKQVEVVAGTDATVLILGESGTGKELIAREIQERGRRVGRPFVRVNCSAIPREMFESVRELQNVIERAVILAADGRYAWMAASAL